MYISESQIENAEQLRGAGRFQESLLLTLTLLEKAADETTRMRLLYDIVYNSSQLRLDDLTNQCLKELSTMPQPEVSEILASAIVANALIDRGQADKALQMIEANLRSEVLMRPGFLVEHYDHLAYKGKALRVLGKWAESLKTLKEAQEMFPDATLVKDSGRRTHIQWMIKEIKRNMFHDYCGLKKYNEAYRIAEILWRMESGEGKTLSLYYMGISLADAGRWIEAIKILTDVERSLPSPLINETDLRRDIETCMKEILGL